MGEADKVRIELGKASEAGPCLWGIYIEDSQDGFAFVRRDRIAGDEDVVVRKEERDATRGVTRRRDDLRRPLPAQWACVVNELIELYRCRRTHGPILLKQRDLPRKELRIWPSGSSLDDVRVKGRPAYFRGGDLRELGRGAPMVTVAVGQEDLGDPDILWPGARQSGERFEVRVLLTGDSGIDEYEACRLLNCVGLYDWRGEAIQPVCELFDLFIR